ncbi:hypothetical protein LWI28_002222 [Acer negundo]|uniref:Uncharacterized protein n=1 Tax=Acer negundo TaxID=4023 RepID=A0AAD5IXJ0_ACENE|nr:hypothetical protein LWI28_002222 [Acer negundo]
MRLPPRRVLTQTKRKHRDDLDAPKLSSFTKLPKPITSQPGFHKAAKPDSSNQLLAGYLAHEYLTKATLFGQPFDPAQAQAVPEPSPEKKEEAEPSRGAELEEDKYQSTLSSPSTQHVFRRQSIPIAAINTSHHIPVFSRLDLQLEFYGEPLYLLGRLPLSIGNKC